MRVLLAVALKDLLLLVRDAQAVVFTFFFPLAFGLLFGAIFDSASGGGAGVRAAVVATERTPAEVIEGLSAEPRVQVLLAESERRARLLVRRGKADVGLVFGDPAPAEVTSGPPRPGSLIVVASPGTQAHADLVTGLAMKHASSARAAEIASWLGLPSEAGEAFGAAPLDVTRRTLVSPSAGPENIYSVAFAQSMAWAMMAACAAFAVSIVEERASGALVRLRVAPGGIWPILAGKAAACGVVAVSVCACFAVAAGLWFDAAPERPLLFAAAILAGACCFSGITMLLAVIGRGRGSPGQLAWGVLLACAVSGGAMLPLAFMPSWMEPVSLLSPVRWAIYAVEGALWRDLGWSEVAGPLAVLIGTGAASFALGGGLLAAERRLG